MSQRNSGYARIARDAYFTPPWCTEAIIPHLPMPCGAIWEPAAGAGLMAATLISAGHKVVATDIANGRDFLTSSSTCPIHGIVSNPPFGIATQVIERALAVTPSSGFVGMLLRVDFDSAKTRRHLFGDCPAFAKKLILTRRIRWIEGSTGSPSYNHAWFLWDKRHSGPPVLAYA